MPGDRGKEEDSGERQEKTGISNFSVLIPGLVPGISGNLVMQLGARKFLMCPRNTMAKRNIDW
ncbi:hypothetical protein IM40_01285 [Candidatus Paracaedimonas acanthamoebae]|nr:hypothetical protein IM40_01285 [Candidatus Paracaedimonas acanthamoebae]